MLFLGRRGQTALELMFIFAIIMAGLVVVVNAYVPASSTVSLTYYVRGAASDACSFLATGTVVNETRYSALNTIIISANYSSVGCRVLGVSVEKSTSQWNVTIKMDVAVPLSGSVFKVAVRDYLVNSLSHVNGFSLRGGEIYYKNVPVRINIVCEGCVG